MNAPFPTPIASLDLLMEALVQADQITKADALRAKAAIDATGEAADIILNRLGFVSEEDCADAWGRALNLPLMNVSAAEAGLAAHPDLNRDFLSSHAAAPCVDDLGAIYFAVADPSDEPTLSAGLFALGPKAGAAVIPRAAAHMALERCETGSDKDIAQEDEVIDQDRLRDLASDAPVVKWVDGLFDLAARSGASDIHLEPREDGFRLRLRIDGDLHDHPPPPETLRAAITSRVKIMAGLDISERRLPQDGRIRTAAGGRIMDLRVATAPTPAGETVVIRVLDPLRARIGLNGLGLSQDVEARLTRAADRARGLILVSGPTGAGKSTTLYALLDHLSSDARKILSVEDPVEYAAPGVAQIQAAPKIGLTFAAALRSVLRHDPDVVMVGEIRDRETAQTAIEAALTGHMVLSTVHANSAAATIVRLIDMGVAPYLLASALTGVLAQRLIGRKCACRSGSSAADPDCARCQGRGVDGRLAISEFLEVNDPIRDFILGGADERRIEAAACDGGFTPLAEDLRRRIESGSVDPATANRLGV